MRWSAALLVVGAVLPAPVQAQSAHPAATIEGVMTELYAAVTREPGKPFGWDRLRDIALPGAIMVPQARQRGGNLQPMSVEEFITWIDNGWRTVIGTPNDRGFFERQLKLVVHQYGDIAMAFTTYEKGPYTPRAIQGRGINAVQLVRQDGRWWLASIAWDEENSAGPIPPAYSGS